MRTKISRCSDFRTARTTGRTCLLRMRTWRSHWVTWRLLQGPRPPMPAIVTKKVGACKPCARFTCEPAAAPSPLQLNWMREASKFLCQMGAPDFPG